MISYAQESSFYVIGGTLQRNARSYVQRQADRDLYEGLSQGRFCYVLTARQMGKSSLMVRTAARLREEGFAVALLDLTAIGQNLTAEQWYDGLLGLMGQQLNLENELEDFWIKQNRTGALQRWMRAIREVVLRHYTGRVVIFIDEIDAVRSLPFSTDEFFAGIREFYNHRAEDTELNRLTFCLLGVASPSDLIRDTRMTPFNIGQRIELNDFTETEALPLAQGLGREEKIGSGLLKRVLYWTGGHPYLTQRLCQALLENPDVGSRSGVDRVCGEMFLSSRARERDDNLLFVRERILRSEADLAGLLELYGKVRSQKSVRDDDTNSLISVLRLSGITRAIEGYLSVRNRIYSRVFDKDWVVSNMPDAELRRQKAAYRRGLFRAAAIATVVLAVVTALAFTAIAQRNRAEEERERADINAQEARAALAQAEDQARRADESAQKAQLALVEAETQRKNAEEQRRLAVEQQRIAEQQRQVAVEQQRIVEQQQQANRRLLYAAQMNLAQQAWESANVERVVELLEAQKPGPGEEDLRGFEWHYLRRLCHGAISTLQLPSGFAVGYLSGDGSLLVGQNDDKFIQILDAKTRKDPTRLSFANNPTRTIQMLDAKTGKEVIALKGDKEDYGISHSRDGKRLAIEEKRGVKIVNVETRQETLIPVDIKKDTYFPFTLSPDGKQLAIAYEGIINIFDSDTGKKLNTFTPEAGYIGMLKFSRDGRKLALPIIDGLKLLDISTGKESVPINRFDPGETAFSPDGSRIATYRKDVSIWDAVTGQELAVFKGHTDFINSVEFSPDGKRLITASGDQTVKLWDLTTKQELATLKGHTGSIRSAAFSPDGKQIVTASDDKTVKTWSIATEQEAVQLENGYIEYAAFSPDGNKLAFSTRYTVRLFDIGSGEISPAFNSAPSRFPTEQFSYQDKLVAFSPDGKTMAASFLNSTVSLWDITTRQNIWTFSPNNNKQLGSMVSVMFDPGGKHLLTTGDDNKVTLWDITTKKQLMSFEGHSKLVNSVTISPDGKRLATASYDNTAKLWSLATGKEEITLKGHKDPVISVVFSSDGKWLATASDDNTAKLWDVATGKELIAFKGHKGNVNSVTFSPDNRRLITTSGDGTMKIWDISAQQEVFTFKAGSSSMRSAAFSPDGKLLATATNIGAKLLAADAAQSPLLEPNVVRWHTILAKKRVSERKWAEAEAELREAMRMEPDKAAYYADLGDVLSYQRKYEEAERAYRIAKEMEPARAERHAALGRVLILRGKWLEAEAKYREAVRMEPDNSEYHNHLGVSMFRQYKDAEAESAYREAARIAPNNPNHHSSLGAILLFQKRYVEAEAAFKEALRINPNMTHSLSYLGYLWAELGQNLEEALKMTERAAKAVPANAYYLDNLGWVYFKLGQLDQAERYLTEAARDTEIAERHQARIQEHLGDLYRRVGKNDLARAAWQKALSLTGDAEQKARLAVKLKEEK